MTRLGLSSRPACGREVGALSFTQRVVTPGAYSESSLFPRHPPARIGLPQRRLRPPQIPASSLLFACPNWTYHSCLSVGDDYDPLENE